MKVQKEGRRIEQRSGARRSVALLSMAAIMLLVAIFGYVVYVNFQRLGDLDRLAARQNGQVPADAQPGDPATPPTALAAAQPIEAAQPLPKPEPVATMPATVEMTVPAPPKNFPRGTVQGLRNNVIHSPNQPRPDLLQP